MTSCLLQHSVRPSAEDFKELLEPPGGSSSADSWLNRWCLNTVVSADNPFIPGMTLSALLSERMEKASHVEKRRLLSAQEKVHGLLLEVLERLPKTVREFRGGVEGCAAVFEPEEPAQDPRYFHGPLSVALLKRPQMEVLCESPLVMDFLSLVFKDGLPDLMDSNNLCRDEEEIKHLQHQRLTLVGGGGGKESRWSTRDQADKFLQGTRVDFGRSTVLPGAQFIAAGVAAKPCRYYHVPALRIVLDFLSYTGMLVFFCFFVLLHDGGAPTNEQEGGASRLRVLRDHVYEEDVTITWGEVVFAVYVLVSKDC